MNIQRPPKEIDLPTVLFTKEGYRPAYGKTRQLEKIRSNYVTHEATLRLQESAAFLARALMLGAEFSHDPEAAQYARKHAAITLLTAAWHSYAEERPNELPYPTRGVRRRRLRLPDYSYIQPHERPTTEQLHEDATRGVIDCILSTKRSIEAARTRVPNLLTKANVATGRMLGNTATKIICASIGDKWASNPSLSVFDSQVQMMVMAQRMLFDAIKLEKEVGHPPSLAMMADPRGNELQTYLKDTMPRALVDPYHDMEQALMPV